MAEASIEDTSKLLDWALCINYLLYFQKNTIEIKALIDFKSKVNALMLVYALKLIGLQVY